MEDIVAVRFKNTGKRIYLETGKFVFKVGDLLLAMSDRGQEIARVVKVMKKSDVPKNIEVGKVIRPIGKQDLVREKKNNELAKEALEFCSQKIKELRLNMKAITAEYTFDMSKLIIYFSSVDRVDFRELVKKLANEFRARIELRQIGPRDEIKAYPNLGICGREVCCRTYLDEFEPVTIKMAKEQGLQINMPKLSGACGKLMCCLRYEQDVYKENLDKLPKIGTYVTVEGEKAKVVNVDILGLKVKLKFGEDEEEVRYETYSISDIKFSNKIK